MSGFDPHAGTIARSEAIARAERGADPEWWAWMLERVVEVARRKPYLFTDDIELLRQQRNGPSTRENRAIGPLMRHAQRLGICEPTDQWVPSSQRVNHRRHMRVWYSLIYQGPKVKRPTRRVIHDPRQYDFFQQRRPNHE